MTTTTKRALFIPRTYVEPTLQLHSDGGSWLPNIDLIEGKTHFHVYVDVPSLGAADLKLSRSGARTRVRGERQPPYSVSAGAVELRGERLYGAFELCVRVPDSYEKRWQEGSVDGGVLRLTYKIDDD